MTVAEWLEMAQAGARRRGLDDMVPLLDGLAASTTALRAVDWDLASPRRPMDAEAGVPVPGPQATTVPAGPTITALAPRVARGAVRSEHLTEECLSRIAALQPSLNAFITVTADTALAAARAVDKEIAGGHYRGPLHGMPLSLKDLIDVAGTPTTAASLVRRRHLAAADAPVAARLREAGAVFVGKTNLHEFAFGTTNEDSGYGAAHHPRNVAHSPGGSSGGSAIAVATGMCLGTVGTDTGGSIRIPAAACGLVGLKPEWGEISADGVVPLSRQLDHVGPLARSVEDAAALYSGMGGRFTGTLEASSIAGLRLGLPSSYLFERLDEDVDRILRDTIAALQRAGATVHAVDLPHAADTPLVYLPLVLADGAEYHADTLRTHAADYTPAVRVRLEMGGYILGEDYVRAQRGRAVLAREVDAALAGVDVMLAPGLAIPAPPIGAVSVPVKGGIEAVRSAMLRCTQLFNISGHPAVTLPCGDTPAGFPVGLQLVGQRRGTVRLLQHALAVERAIASA